jgi:hypothetical protein
MSDELLDVGIEEAGAMVTLAMTVCNRLVDLGVEDKPQSAPLQRGAMTNGEAMALVGGLFSIALAHYPALVDRDTLNACTLLVRRPVAPH